MNRRAFLKSAMAVMAASAAAPALKYLAPINPMVQAGKGSALVMDNLGGYLVPQEFAEQLVARRVLRCSIPISQELLDDAFMPTRISDQLRVKPAFIQWLENGGTDA